MNIQNLYSPNFILFDDISILPFPEEIKGLVENIDWKTIKWQTFGLPIVMATYSIVSGKTLYLDELPDGSSNIQKQEFTGEISTVAFLFDNGNFSDYHYITSFSLVFFKGELKEVKFLELEKISKNEYEANIKHLNEGTNKKLRFRTSWKFLYLYRPYKKFIQWIFFLPIGLTTLIRWILIAILRKITPW